MRVLLTQTLTICLLTVPLLLKTVRQRTWCSSGNRTHFPIQSQHAGHKSTDEDNPREAVVGKNTTYAETSPRFKVKPFVLLKLESTAQHWWLSDTFWAVPEGHGRFWQHLHYLLAEAQIWVWRPPSKVLEIHYANAIKNLQRGLIVCIISCRTS